MTQKIIISLLLLVIFVSACGKTSDTNNGLNLYHERLYFNLNSLSEEINCEDSPNSDLCVLKEAINNQDVSFCEQMQSDLFKFDCYTKIAELKQDFSVCDRHDMPLDENSNFAGMHIWQFLCYENIIIAKGEIQLCEDTFEEKEGQDSCYSDFAGVSGDVTICDTKVNDPERKTFCYIYVAEALGDPSLCEDKIEDEYYQQGCYTNVALATKDKSICDELVTLEEFKDDCDFEFSQI
tara:strand:+ start:48 stop:758 length:711 start_codon:yes stop_codon:yes gene_type:complete